MDIRITNLYWLYLFIGAVNEGLYTVQMTLQEILDCDADKLEALDKEGKLEDYLRPYFCVTRPEYAKRVGGNSTGMLRLSDEKKVAFDNVKKSTGLDLAKMMVDLGIKNKKKK